MSTIANKAGKPWDRYAEDAEDREYVEILRMATKAVQAALAAKGIASALIGGTALRLVEGLPRMSRDLDLKVTRATTGADEAVIEAVNVIPGWKAHKARIDDEARGLEGIVIANERSGRERAMAIELIPGTLGGVDTVGVASEWMCERGEVMTYPTHVLAQLKMNTLLGERPREMAHDVFDVAWLVDKHGYLIDPEHRTALKEWVAEAKNRAQAWIEVFRQEPHQQWSWHETIETMSEGLERADEIVHEAARLEGQIREVHRRTDDAKLSVTVNEYGRMEGAITGGNGQTETYGGISRCEVIAMALNAVENLDKREIPELVLTLERERGRQQARAQGKGLS